MEATYVSLTDEEILARRAAALERSGMSEEKLRRKGADWMLDAEEQACLEEVERMDYLLGRG